MEKILYYKSGSYPVVEWSTRFTYSNYPEHTFSTRARVNWLNEGKIGITFLENNRCASGSAIVHLKDDTYSSGVYMSPNDKVRIYKELLELS